MYPAQKDKFYIRLPGKQNVTITSKHDISVSVRYKLPTINCRNTLTKNIEMTKKHFHVCTLIKNTCLHLFRMKFDVSNIKIENSFPWTENPSVTSSQTNLPSPAPGTKTSIADRLSLSGKRSHKICIVSL